LQLDEHLKNLLRELGHAINDTVSESDRITGAIAGVRAHGYDIVLKLDATIGLAKRDGAAADDAKLTSQDKRFLESLRIQVDQESMAEENDKKPAPRLAMTPQDVRFLKSLRISTDDVE
jgi:hypothetical protein